MLKVRVLEELPADDARLAGDVNVSVALCRALDIWPGQDLWFALNLYTRVPQNFKKGPHTAQTHRELIAH